MLIPTLLFALPLEPTPAPPGAQVYFISPLNGEKVQSPFTVRFGLKNMGIAPAGTNIKNTGHHHLSIDGSYRPNLNEPMGKEVIHLDNGETEIDLFLPPGTHTLQILFGDSLHRPHDPPIMSEQITIEVSSDK